MAYIRPYRGKWRAEIEKHGQRLSKLVASEQDAKLWAQATEARLDAESSRYRRGSLVANGPDIVTLVPRCVLDASREIPHSQAIVLAAAIPMILASGIYFLLRKGEVIYVGQSVDVLHRIARHRREGRTFDAFSYMECDPEDLDRLETLYIKAFVPVENLTFGNHREPGRHLGARKRGSRAEAKADSSALMSEPHPESPAA